MRLLLKWLLIPAILYALWCYFAPISRPPGVLTRSDPEQTLFASPPAVISLRGWKLQPLALYTIEARVLSIATYSGDPSDDLAPYDLAVGWGPMSDTAVLEKLDISQSNRFFHWQYWGSDPPIPEREIITHSANMHLIPADESVLSRIKSLRKGSLVRMSGYLVECRHPLAARPWRSSLTREDTGDGACEIMYVRMAVER